jgi:glucuronate isomerase
MKSFITDTFLLHSDAAVRLYNEYAQPNPIIDYHCHLPPDLIANDHQFRSLTEAWLAGDHYKWRAMRINGVDERFCTGPEPDKQKFLKWAETVPYTIRNPLYHWTHLELKRYFGIDSLLNGNTAESVYNECSEMLAGDSYSVKNLLRKMKVEVLCTTDDPCDDLRFHKQLRDDAFDIKVFPAFRPDKAMNFDDLQSFNLYCDKLMEVSGIDIIDFNTFLLALRQRHDYFAAHGCTVSDHGLQVIFSDDFSATEVTQIFSRVRKGASVEESEKRMLQSCLLHEFAIWDNEKNWVQQYHLGALRNNNSKKKAELGPDTGWDSIGDDLQATALSKFLDRLNQKNSLTKTILYNLNPSLNEVFTTMTGNFNEGESAGKIQHGAAWWFLDQKEGMTRHLNSLSNMGLLSRFVGMITDSRSFLSYPRHEYFRRLLCNLIGEEIEKGELPADFESIGPIVRSICYDNAKQYFGW